jgi:hypothetical protein
MRTVHAEVEEFTDHGKRERERRRAAIWLRAWPRCVACVQSRRRLGRDGRHGPAECFRLVVGGASSNPWNSGRTKNGQESDQRNEGGDTHGSKAEHPVPCRISRSLEGEMSTIPHPSNGTWSVGTEGSHPAPSCGAAWVDRQPSIVLLRSPWRTRSRARLPRSTESRNARIGCPDFLTSEEVREATDRGSHPNGAHRRARPSANCHIDHLCGVARVTSPADAAKSTSRVTRRSRRSSEAAS